MFTPKKFKAPDILKGDIEDLRRVVKAFADFLNDLEGPDSLVLTEAELQSINYLGVGVGTGVKPLNASVTSAFAAASQWGNAGGLALFPTSGGGAIFYAWNGTIGSESYPEVFRITRTRFQADFTNATRSSRYSFQSSTTNGITIVQAIPNGTGANAGFIGYGGGSDADNAHFIQILATGTTTVLNSSVSGTGTQRPLDLQIAGVTGLRVTTAGDVEITDDLTVGGANLFCNTATGDAFLANSAAGFIGYLTGAGGSVAQGSGSGKATGVSLSKPCGQITMDGAALNANTAVSFTLTNLLIAATDVLILNHASGGTAGAYALNAQCGSGSASINVRNITAGSLSEAIVISFALIKGVTS